VLTNFTSDSGFVQPEIEKPALSGLYGMFVDGMMELAKMSGFREIGGSCAAEAAAVGSSSATAMSEVSAIRSRTHRGRLEAT
jgi:hypothetical protein